MLESCATPLPLLKVAGSKDQEVEVGTENFIPGKVTALVIRTRQMENDILLVKNGEEYKALYLKCTHEGVNLTATANKIYCPSHGSSFDMNGKVLKEPALRPLKTFRTELINNQVIIHLS
ncbi:Rieske (2Fe-2S) protein [Mucilaginibacter gynuensis]|uniref:Rieske (2Fe-2S) protein n=1 Tax=Mucilaginibacter gynuensis TaxID=1302236 RepID=A0ABP8HES8_9SPHI